MKKENKKKQIRVDELLVRNQNAETIEEAKKIIMAGLVRLGNDRLISKCNEMLDETLELRVDLPCPYVSRGAYKLKPALDRYLPDLSHKIAADIGASTGGFTDLMLQYGAEKVYAIDVGHGQLHYKLRNHPKVVNIEKVNARNIKRDFLPLQVDLITMDLSFISVKKILPAVNLILKQNGWAFVLIKPQFEAEKNEIEKGGVVKRASVRQKYVKEVSSFAESELKWTIMDIIPSPLKGPKGNQEYIMVAKKYAQGH